MTRGRRKHWRIRLAYEPNRYSSEQLQKTYEQISPDITRHTMRALDAGQEMTKRKRVKGGTR